MKSPSASIWPLTYAGLGIAAAIAPNALRGVTPVTAIEPVIFRLMVFGCMPLLSVFSGVRSYFSLVRRTTPKHLHARIWDSAPTNPQSSQLSQIIGFGCFGISAAVQPVDLLLQMFGIFGIWTSAALVISLWIFRARHVRSAVTTKTETVDTDSRP